MDDIDDDVVVVVVVETRVNVYLLCERTDEVGRSRRLVGWEGVDIRELEGFWERERE